MLSTSKLGSNQTLGSLTGSYCWRFPSSLLSTSYRSASLRPLCSKSMDQMGVDSDGNTISSRVQLWVQEAGENVATGSCSNPQKKQKWYDKGVSYWQGVEASVDGVLGGYGHVNDRDVATSDEFLKEVLGSIPDSPLLSQRQMVALDCGAGVGRVTKNLLLRHFHEVDLVEPVSHFLEAAKENLKDGSANSPNGGRAVNFFCKPLQEFTPQPNRYDVIWVQWCIGHLTDQDFVSFFKRAKAGLKTNGFFVMKENTAQTGFVVDKVDSSVTRSDAYYRDLFAQAGLHLYKSKLQKGFPKELFAVRMYALTTQEVKPKPVPRQTRAKTKNSPGVIV